MEVHQENGTSSKNIIFVKAPVNPDKKPILIIKTGGTLCCVEEKEGEGLKPGVKNEEFKKKINPVLSENDEIIIEDLFSLDSANMNPSHWKQMADKIGEYYKKVIGVIIVQGTDTLAYTSSMLSCMLKGIPIPVVITGSQLSITNPVADALENIRAAIHMARSGYPGVFVAFDRKIMLGNHVSKVHSKSFDAFGSINIEDVATINAYGMQINENILPKVDKFFRVRSNYCDKVFLLKLVPGLKTDIIDLIVNAGYKGIVIEGYGLGGLPFEGENYDFVSKCAKVIKEKGILIVITTQCTYGGTNLNIYETGVRTKNIGIIDMPYATKEYAYTRLMWELGNNS